MSRMCSLSVLPSRSHGEYTLADVCYRHSPYLLVVCRLQGLLDDVRRGDKAAIDRRWAGAMRGEVGEGDQNVKQQIVRK